jgi:hypothetical protein
MIKTKWRRLKEKKGAANKERAYSQQASSQAESKVNWNHDDQDLVQARSILFISVSHCTSYIIGPKMSTARTRCGINLAFHTFYTTFRSSLGDIVERQTIDY